MNILLLSSNGKVSTDFKMKKIWFEILDVTVWKTKLWVEVARPSKEFADYEAWFEEEAKGNPYADKVSVVISILQASL